MEATKRVSIPAVSKVSDSERLRRLSLHTFVDILSSVTRHSTCSTLEDVAMVT